MNEKQRRTWAEISLKNIEHNIRQLREATPEGTRFLGVVKADSYGHGALRVALMMQEKSLAEYLAVTSLDEASELRHGGIQLPILIMAYTPTEYAADLQRLEVTQAVGDAETAGEMAAYLHEPLKVHLKIETGMGRTGFDMRNPDFESDIRKLYSIPELEIEGVFTHFAVSDEPQYDFTSIQYAKFKEVLAKIEEIAGKSVKIAHCANSGGVINYREYSADMVRPGIATYGLYPGADTGGIDLRPAMQLKSQITHIYDHLPGDTIGYGRTHVLNEKRRIAVVPIGYADGLHRAGSGKYEFLLNGKRVRQVGRICMDMCMIDVTDFPDCKKDDIVTIFGVDGGSFISVEEQAEKAGTISYEMVCAVSKRVPRVYDN